jgi:hypothetical protein
LHSMVINWKSSNKGSLHSMERSSLKISIKMTSVRR